MTHHLQVSTSRPGIKVDEGMVSLVEAAWTLGLATSYSCQGITDNPAFARGRTFAYLCLPYSHHLEVECLLQGTGLSFVALTDFQDLPHLSPLPPATLVICAVPGATLLYFEPEEVPLVTEAFQAVTARGKQARCFTS